MARPCSSSREFAGASLKVTKDTIRSCARGSFVALSRAIRLTGETRASVPLADDCDSGIISRRLLARRAEGCRRSEEHTSELPSLMRISYAVFRVHKKTLLTAVPCARLLLPATSLADPRPWKILRDTQVKHT